MNSGGFGIPSPGFYRQESQILYVYGQFFSSFASKDEESEEKLNIFSVASGHLYERFLKIMMLSVLKQTKTPVKFWFLKNYLSPQIKVAF